MTSQTRFIKAVSEQRKVSAGAWLGEHLVPAKVRSHPLTVMRAADGAGVACAPSLDPRTFSDPNIEQGEAAVAILEAMAAFDSPSTLDAAVTRMVKRAGLDPDLAQAVIEQLIDGQFIQTA